MIRIAASPPPSAFAFARSNGASFISISSDPEVRKALWREQNGLCAYCERALKTHSGQPIRTRIEHFHPQRVDPESAQIDAGICRKACGTSDLTTAGIAWSNLLLCCDGGERERVRHCDVLKSNRHICADFRNPKTSDREQCAKVLPTGTVVAAAGMPEEAGSVIDDVLGLNVRHLVAARRRIYSQYLQEIKREKDRSFGLTPSRRRVLREKLIEASKTKAFPSTLLAVAGTL